MRNYFTVKRMKAQMAVKEFAEKLLKNEEGDTNFVSIVLIMVIVIAVAVIFKDALLEAAKAVTGQLTDFIEGGGESGEEEVRAIIGAAIGSFKA